jgi:hypothetical protein
MYFSILTLISLPLFALANTIVIADTTSFANPVATADITSLAPNAAPTTFGDLGEKGPIYPPL